MAHQAQKKSKGFYRVMFLVSLVATIGLLIFANEWFWLALPSLLTGLVYSLDVI
jgi:4-hydroxybenzoate polyprenyltransferase